jgi:hypothetical protein
MTRTIPCPDCGGYGTVEVGRCVGGADHAGHDCHGLICGGTEYPCERCDGTGEAECGECGEWPAIENDWGENLCAKCVAIADADYEEDAA